MALKTLKKLITSWCCALTFVSYLVALVLCLDHSFKVPIDWEDVDVTPVKGPDGNFRLPPKIFESMAKTQLGLKGPLATPIGKGHQSLNLALRK